MDKRNVLVVEDESIVALDICRTLKKMGIKEVFTARNYKQAINSVNSLNIDIILMDINLKDSKDGIFVAKEIKKIKDIPIIFLTAFSDDETIDKAIDCEPVGYLLKPFKKAELSSTIKIAINKIERGSALNNSNKLETLNEDFFYDKKTYMLYYNDEPIKLSKNEKHFLSLLVACRGSLLTFEDIENNIWPDKAVSNSTVRSLIHRFRCKTNPNLIETIPGYGCKLK